MSARTDVSGRADVSSRPLLQDLSSGVGSGSAVGAATGVPVTSQSESDEF